MASKYEPLGLYLRSIDSAVKEVTLTFSKIQELLGFPLPASASTYRPWWANQKDVKNRPQAKSWISAGFNVDTAYLDGSLGWVRFRRR